MFKIFNPISGLIINAITQVLSCRYFKKLGLLKSAYLGFISGFIVMLILDTSIFITNWVIYFLLGYCYFHFLNLGETSRRIRILRELYDSKEGLSLDELLIRYNAKEIFEKRMSRLLNNAQIIYRDGVYYIGSPIMLLIARVMAIIKLIIVGNKSKFDKYV